MIINTDITIAYKCSSCGTFEFFDISLFKLLFKKVCHHQCRCKKSRITVFGGNTKELRITIPCIACGEDHLFIISRKAILDNEVNIFYCPKTGMQQCFVGKDSEVRKKIDTLEKELDELINMFGYDSYFENTQVMFDALNKIHDIAEHGSLYCECGNDDIELVLLSDRILLKCKKCIGNRVVNAASNEDLKHILTKHQIVLPSGFSGYDTPHAGSCMRKTDRR